MALEKRISGFGPKCSDFPREEVEVIINTLSLVPLHKLHPVPLERAKVFFYHLQQCPYHQRMYSIFVTDLGSYDGQGATILEKNKRQIYETYLK